MQTQQSLPCGGKFPTCQVRPAYRSGLTLVELLVVILIIAVLAALVTPAVMRAQVAARNAAIKAEIDMLHMAIMNYKNEYGSFPPALDTVLTGTSAACRHLSRLFPRCTTVSNELASVLPGGMVITGTNAIKFWLSGYTDDPTLPLTGGNRNKLFDFDASRVNQSTQAYYPNGKPGSPYLYINSSLYPSIPYAGGNSVTPGAIRATFAGDPTPFSNSSQPFANEDTFQILCAGRDETFGTDDDLSNFWPGTRQNYKDSLSQ